MLLLFALAGRGQAQHYLVGQQADGSPDGVPLFANAFTPNGDGVNDLYVPSPVQFRHYTIRIQDRSGREVFLGHADKHWDGRSPWGMAPMGVYFYSFDGQTAQGVRIRRTGSITLIR